MINNTKKSIYLVKFLFYLVFISSLLIFDTDLKAKAYTSDLGNGSFQNPVLYADYPDVSVIKVDSTYYMLTSSISYTPGLPVVKPEEKPSTPDINKPSLDSLKLDYTINNWGESYQVNFKIINNTSSSVNGWTLKIKKSSINIETSWNITVNESEDYYVITPVNWNAFIAAGNNIEFGIQGNGSIGNTIDYTLN